MQGGHDAVERYDKGDIRRTSDSRADLSITLAQVRSRNDSHLHSTVRFGSVFPHNLRLQAYTGSQFSVSVKRRVVCRGFVSHVKMESGEAKPIVIGFCFALLCFAVHSPSRCSNSRSAECSKCTQCPAETRTVKRRMGPFVVNQQEKVEYEFVAQRRVCTEI